MKKKNFKKVSFFVDDLVSMGSKKRGFHLSLILMKWKDVVGDYFSDKTLPLKITFDRRNNEGILHVGINEAFAPEINLEKEILIEKINQIYGRKFITRLKLKNDEIFIEKEKNIMTKDRKIINSNINHLKKNCEYSISKIHNEELKLELKKLANNIRKKVTQNF